jgi:hypothetical protein
VLFNDVLPENTDKSKRIVKVACGETRRLRIINMSSHARFYVWFSDQRDFDIIELDGVSYARLTTKLFEIASGQRVSILVKSPADSTCKPANIVVVSDPKVGHGTRKCPTAFTTPGRGVQFTHGLLDICDDSTSACSKEPAHNLADLDPTNADQVGNVRRFLVYSKPDTSDAKAMARFHYYPSGGTISPVDSSWADRKSWDNRIQLVSHQIR